MQQFSKCLKGASFLLCALLCSSPTLTAQDNHAETHRSASKRQAKANTEQRSVLQDAKDTGRRFVLDQKFIWTSPTRLKASDAGWLVPSAGVATGLFVTDRRTSHELSRNSHKNTSVSFSNAGLAALAGTAGSMYFLGVHNQDGKMRETGMLAGEAAADGFTVDEALKYAFRRDRPNVAGGQGAFFQSASSGSFPSAHATTSFAIATVLADEYPGPLTKVLGYGLATAVSMARVTGQQHFPSDVFIGAGMGYLIGHSVYRNHHDPTVQYGTFETLDQPLAAERMSSTYIEMDSWIYPAVERLAALGIINDTFAGIRPWTRMAVYAMIAPIEESDLSGEANALISALRSEFTRESELKDGAANHAIRVDRVYSRTQYISGTPLNDGFHFGQTIVNDFGRPYGHGLQQIDGFETRAEEGRFSFFVRGEYQHSPAQPGYSNQLNQTLASIDVIPGETFRGQPRGDVFRLLDTYVSMNLFSNEISVGKQTYWWAPNDSTALMLSDNAAPFYGIRINRVLPLYLPLFSKLLGTIRYDNFFGRLYGNNYPADPFTFGQKISLQPTKNLELGFSRSSIFAGKGLEPLTFGTFKTSFSSLSSGTDVGFNPHRTPGTRHGSFDFRYRLPYLRNWLTLYADSFAHDDVSPLDAPRRAAVMSGIYLSHFPKISKLDLHVEGGTTDTVTSRARGGNFYYYESLYKDSYTINRNLLGSWIGREGTGGQAWATYWLNPQSTIVVGARDVKVSQYFLPQGETQQEFYGSFKYRWRNGLDLDLLLQDERWVAPLLATGPQHDFTSQIQFSFWPGDWKLQKR